MSFIPAYSLINTPRKVFTKHTTMGSNVYEIYPGVWTKELKKCAFGVSH